MSFQSRFQGKTEYISKKGIIKPGISHDILRTVTDKKGNDSAKSIFINIRK